MDETDPVKALLGWYRQLLLLPAPWADGLQGLTAVLGKVIDEGVDIERAFGFNSSPHRALTNRRRDELILQCVALHYTGISVSKAAETFSEDLEDYAAVGWLHDKAKSISPSPYAPNTLKWFQFRILKLTPNPLRTLQPSRLRDILRPTSSPT